MSAFRVCEQITFNAEAAEAAEKKCLRISPRALRALRSNVVFFHRLFRAKDAPMWASQLGTVEELGDWPNHSRTLRIRSSLTRRHNGGILFGGCVDLEAGRSTILRDHPRARGEPPRLADLIVGREVGCLEDRGEVQEG